MRKTIKITRRQACLLSLGTLAAMGAVAVDGVFKSLSNPSQATSDRQRDFTVTGDAALRARAAAKGLIYGAATSDTFLYEDREFARHFARECAMVVSEVVLKWDILRPSLNRFNFAPGDRLVEFARQHNMLFRGHTLVWHKSLPPWLPEILNSQNARQLTIEHITTVASHYAGKVHSWDVVNEAVRPADGRADGLRNTPWLQFLGTDYIKMAFETAAAADPQAMLVYNDYGLDYDTPEDEAKRIAVLKLLERLKSTGTPVHALGIQAHLYGDERRFNPEKLKAFLQDVASLGLKILITELDVTDNNLPLDTVVRDRRVAEVYEDYLSVVLDSPAVIAVLTWGLSDRYTWLSASRSRGDGAPVRPLPLDANLNRKLAWNALARAFDKARDRLT